MALRHVAEASGRDRESVEGPFELLQARAIIECAISEEAARNAGPQDIAVLDEALRAMSGAVEDARAVLVADRAFHTGIAAIVGNATLLRVTGELFDMKCARTFRLQDLSKPSTATCSRSPATCAPA